MPLTAAEQRARRLAEQRRRVSSAQHTARRAYAAEPEAEPNEGARSPVASPGGGAGGIDSDSDDGAGDGADDVFAAEASDDARSPCIPR